MALTPSTMLPLGTHAPAFHLDNVYGGAIDFPREGAGSHGTLILFICNHCPYVKHIQDELIRIARDYQPKGIGILAISSNDPVSHPADAPERMAEIGYPFPYLFDATQEVAKAYHAACTPDLFLFDRDLRLAYRGQLDGSRPGNAIPVDGRDLRAAMDAVLAGEILSDVQIPSIGCNIKWRQGNEPAYFHKG